MYDAKFYQMLSECEDAIMARSEMIEILKQEIAMKECNKTKELLEEMRDNLSEAYLSREYAMSLYQELEPMLSRVKLMDSFISGRVSTRTFNLQCEDVLGDM